MKKLILALVLASLCQIPVLFAQQIPPQMESDYYYINVPIDRIYPYRLGYVVEYRSGTFQVFRAYVPRAWFDHTDSRGEFITLRPSSAWPSMTVFYNQGEFSHVRLRVREKSHSSWGNIIPGVVMGEQFEGVEDLRLQF